MTQYLDVFLDGVRAGRLTQAPGGAVTFSYDDKYTTRRSPTPLSLSMPLTRSGAVSKRTRISAEKVSLSDC